MKSRRELALECAFALVLCAATTVFAADADATATTNPPSVTTAEAWKLGHTKAPVKLVGTLVMPTETTGFFLADKSGQIRVRLLTTNSFQRGDLLEVIGVPTIIEWTTWIDGASARRLGVGSIPPPLRISATNAVRALHEAQYVTLRGRVTGTNVVKVRGFSNEALLVESEGVSCKILFPNGTGAGARWPAETVADFTGVCRLGGRVEEDDARYVHIVTAGPDAVTVVRAAPFWTRERLHLTVVAGVSALLGGAVFILIQSRKVKILRASEEKFRALVDNSFDATYVLNPDGTLKYMSPSGARLLALPSSNVLLAPTLDELIHPEDLPLIREAHLDVLKTPGKSRRIENYRLVRADGSVIIAEAIGTNCLHVAGVEGVVVNVRDITEREMARRELERSELLQRRINEFATSLSPLHTEDDILWEITRQCISVLDFEDCVVYLLDESRGVLLQKAAYGPKNPREREIVSPIEIPLGKGIVGSVAISGRAEIIADTSRDPRYILDDAARLSEITVPICAEGKVLAVIDSENPQKNFFTREHLTVLTAIASISANKLVRARAESRLRRMNEELEQRVHERTTELAETNTKLRGEVVARELAEAELRVALKAEQELNQLKSSFVSMVSHEFRTPLEVILSSSNILDRYFDRLAPDQRVSQLRAIRKSVHRMNDLIEDVLLLGKFDAGAMVCCPTPLDLEKFCRRAVSEIESATGRENVIDLTVDAAGDANADDGLLQHIIVNLLSNAVKYSPTAARIEFAVGRRGADAEFIIRDRGCGIPATDQGHLFTAFYRGANVGQTHGSGLGLVIVKRCVDLHGGTIRCESVEGAGTTFTVALPLFDDTRIFRRRTVAATATKLP